MIYFLLLNIGFIQSIVDCISNGRRGRSFMQAVHNGFFLHLQGLLPRGKSPNPLRDRNKQVNELLAEAMPSMPNALLLDVDPGFVHSDGTVSHNDMYDYLHLSRLGYARICQPLHKTLLKLLEGRGQPDQHE